jgi:hypothetical protein
MWSIHRGSYRVRVSAQPLPKPKRPWLVVWGRLHVSYSSASSGLPPKHRVAAHPSKARRRVSRVVKSMMAKWMCSGKSQCKVTELRPAVVWSMSKTIFPYVCGHVSRQPWRRSIYFALQNIEYYLIELITILVRSASYSRLLWSPGCEMYTVIPSNSL